MTTTAADLLVACLRAEGVDRVFGIPGEETLELNRALDASPIDFVPVRHEQAAALMAGMHGRLTGRPGVCLATLGPGATNLVSGLADGLLDRAPVVALTGQGETTRLHKESHQNLDLVAVTRPVTKWSARVTSAEAVPELVRKAFALATAEQPGPVCLALPEDVMAAPSGGSPLPVRATPRPEPSREDVLAAAELIASAERPVILAGNGVLRGRAGAVLHAFARATGIPVAMTFMGKGAVPAGDPLDLGTVGLGPEDFELAGFHEADLVITAGYDLVEEAPSAWNPDGRRRVVCLDTRAPEIDAAFTPELALVGDVARTLERLTDRLGATPPSGDGGGERQEDQPRSALAALAQRHLATGRGDDAFPLRPGRALADLRDALGDDDLLVSDVGLHKLWVARAFPARRPGTVFVPNGLAGMGVALPMAIAAQLERPDRRVVALCGDGGFLMNCQELETAVRLRTPVTCVVWEDQALSAIVTKQDDRYGRTFGTGFGVTDLVGLALSFGMPAWRCSSASDLGRRLPEALSSDRPSLIAVPVEYAVHPHLHDDPAQESLTA